MPFSIRQTDSSLWIPSALCGMVGFLVALALSLLGGVAPLETLINSKLASLLGTEAIVEPIKRELIFVFGLVFASLLALSMLDTPGKMRRILILVSSVLLILGLVPVGVLFNRDLGVAFLVVSTAAAGLSALYWGAHHRMPCERMVKTKRASVKQKEDLLKTKRISLKALEAGPDKLEEGGERTDAPVSVVKSKND